MVLYPVTPTPNSFHANYDGHVLESKLLYGHFNCFTTQNN